jgi:hypothetical protein
MADKIGLARGRLSAAMGEARRALTDMTEGTSHLATRRTEVVAGVLGGSGAMTVAYIATAFSASVSFFFLGPLLGIVGISAGVLVGRQLKLTLKEDEAERRRRLIEENCEAERIVRERLGSLPAGTPKAIKDDLYRNYMELNRQLTEILRPELNLRALPPPPPTNLLVGPQITLGQPRDDDDIRDSKEGKPT